MKSDKLKVVKPGVRMLLRPKVERTALEIQRLLQTQGMSREAEQLLRHPTSCGNYLSRLASGSNPRVTKRLLHGIAQYTVLPPRD